LKRGRQITGAPAVELILDAVGGDSLKKGYRLLAPTGRLGMFGMSSAATNKTGGIFGALFTLASTPWLQFNPLSLMNAKKGVSRFGSFARLLGQWPLFACAVRCGGSCWDGRCSGSREPSARGS
jgi:hypothetical protein